MKLLIDSNVILDVLLERQPFFAESMEALKLCERDDVQEYVSASAVTDIYYIAERMLRDKKKVRQLIEKLLKVLSVAAVTGDEIANALELDWGDFEDSVQYSVALLGSMDGVITRNPKDFEDARLPVWTPAEVVARVMIEGKLEKR